MAILLNLLKAFQVTIKVTKGLAVTEFYDAPASVLTGDLLILNLVKLSKLGVGLIPIKPK